MGHLPQARLYSTEDFSFKYSFSGHKFKINCVKFSPKGNILVTIGSLEDQSVYLWNRNTLKRIASSKTCNIVNAVTFSQVGDYFVTAGSRIIKFWYPKSYNKKKTEEIPLESRNVILNENLYNNFVDIISIKDSLETEFIYALSTNSCLLKIDAKRQVILSTKLESTISKCLTIFHETLLVGHNQRRISVLKKDNLSTISTVELDSNGSSKKYDIISIGYNPECQLLTTFFTDFSFEIWKIDNNQPYNLVPLKVLYEERSHSEIIWSIMPISQNIILHMYLTAKSSDIILFERKFSLDELKQCFFSSSDDGTVILWKLNNPRTKCQDINENVVDGDPCQPSYPDDKMILYRLDVQRVFGEFLADNEDEVKSNQRLLTSISFGLKCLSLNNDCSHLAIGNKSGELLIFSAQTKDKLLYLVNAHESDVTCLNYFSSSTDPKMHILGTGGRDRLIKLWNVTANYTPLYTLSDHSGAIIFLNIHESLPNCASLPCVRLVSCSSDKAIIFRSLDKSSDITETKFQIYSQLLSKSSQASAMILPKSSNLYVLCQDRKIRVYSMDKGRPVLTLKANPFKDGPMGVCAANFDGAVMAISNSDKRISLLCPFSGNLFSILSGHSETITSMAFLQTRRHLITTSCDHTILIWHLPKTFDKISLNQSTIDISSVVNYRDSNRTIPKNPAIIYNWKDKIPQTINLSQYTFNSLTRCSKTKRIIEKSVKAGQGRQGASNHQVNQSTPNPRSTSVPAKMLNRFVSQDSIINSDIFDNESDNDDDCLTNSNHLDNLVYNDYDLMPKWAKDKSVLSLNNLDLVEHVRHTGGHDIKPFTILPSCYTDDSIQKVTPSGKRLTTSLYEPIEIKAQMTSSSSGIGLSTSPSVKSYRLQMTPRNEERRTLAMSSSMIQKHQDKYSRKKRSEDHSESSISSSSSRVRACWSKSTNCDVSIKPDSSRRNSSIGKFTTYASIQKNTCQSHLDDEKDSSSSTITSIKENSRLSDSSKLNVSIRRPMLICNFFSKLALELDKLNGCLERSHWTPGELAELQQSFCTELEPRFEQLHRQIGLSEKYNAAGRGGDSMEDQNQMDYVRQVMDSILPQMQDLQVYLRSTSSSAQIMKNCNFDSDPPTLSSELVYENSSSRLKLIDSRKNEDSKPENPVGSCNSRIKNEI